MNYNSQYNWALEWTYRAMKMWKIKPPLSNITLRQTLGVGLYCPLGDTSSRCSAVHGVCGSLGKRRRSAPRTSCRFHLLWSLRNDEKRPFISLKWLWKAKITLELKSSNGTPNILRVVKMKTREIDGEIWCRKQSQQTEFEIDIIMGLWCGHIGL